MILDVIMFSETVVGFDFLNFSDGLNQGYVHQLAFVHLIMFGKCL